MSTDELVVGDPLRIGIVCYASFGGSGIIASELGRLLAKRGHQVHLLASSPPSRAFPACDRLTFHRVAVPEYPLLAHPPYTLSLASTILQVAERERLDVVHVHYAVPHAASAFLARQAMGSGAPALVTTLHGTDVSHFACDPSIGPIARFTVRASDAITVPSAFLHAQAQKLLAIPAEVPIDVIPNFVDGEHFTPAQEQRVGSLREPTLFHVSNFRPIKRVLDLLEVLAHVRRHVPARLVLVGDGPERAGAELRARELGLASHVSFLGPRADFVEQLKQADAFLLPSESESFGLAALEALSCAVPVFGYRVGGLPEVVTEDVGRLVAPFDCALLAQALVNVLEDPTRHRALAQAARARALSAFPQAAAVDSYERVYRRVVGARRGGRS